MTPTEMREAAKFRKKPVEVQAIQWTGGNVAEITAFLNGSGRFRWGGIIEITTIHGEMAIVREGDWIVAEPQAGRFYPVKPDIFATSYEAALPPTEPSSAAISPSDPAVIIAGIRQFGLAPDGSDLRDLEASLARLTAALPLPEPSSGEALVEHVARALCAASYVDPDAPDTYSSAAPMPKRWEGTYAVLARAAIAALAASPAPDGEKWQQIAERDREHAQIIITSMDRENKITRARIAELEAVAVHNASGAIVANERADVATARTAELEGALNAISRAFETPEHLRDIARSALASGSRT